MGFLRRAKFLVPCLSVLLNACSEERYPSKIETFPTNPVIIDTPFRLPYENSDEGVVYKEFTSNWFRTKLRVSNLGSSPLFVISVTFYVLGSSKDGGDASSTDSSDSSKSSKEQDESQAVAKCEKQVLTSTQLIPAGQSQDLKSEEDVAAVASYADDEGELNGDFFYCSGLSGFGSNYARNIKVVLNGWQGTEAKADARIIAFDYFQTQ